jgi:hypothetical protein
LFILTSLPLVTEAVIKVYLQEGESGDIAADYSSLSSRELLTKSLDELKGSLLKRRTTATADTSRVVLHPRGRAAAAAARAAERQAAAAAQVASQNYLQLQSTIFKLLFFY